MATANIKSQLPWSQYVPRASYGESTCKTSPFWFGRHFESVRFSNLHHRFGCQDRHPELGIKKESSKYRILGKKDRHIDGLTDDMGGYIMSPPYYICYRMAGFKATVITSNYGNYACDKIPCRYSFAHPCSVMNTWTPKYQCHRGPLPGGQVLFWEVRSLLTSLPEPLQYISP